MNILIIEDDIDFKESLKRKLMEKGAKVYFINSLTELDSNINFPSISHAIIDLRVKLESGLDFIPKVRSLYPDSFIILLTAFGSITTSVEAIKRGANEYLLKPFSFNDLYKILEKKGQEHSFEQEHPMLDLYQKEKEYIDYILQQNDGNISKSAEVLGIRRQSLQRKLKKYTEKKIE